MEKFNLLGYQTFVCWSDEDECYIANVPALPGCMAHGDTQQECVAMAANAISGWLETADELGGMSSNAEKQKELEIVSSKKALKERGVLVDSSIRVEDVRKAIEYNLPLIKRVLENAKC